MKKLLFSIFLSLLAICLMGQGVTTSSMNGKITDATGESLIGANVQAIHQPTGTFYGNSTDLEGLFRISNMRVGGPYTITISYTGYEDYVQDNVYIRLGKPSKIDVQLSEGAVSLDEVLVSAERYYAGQSSGTSTDINAEDIELMPTLNRDLNDFTRLTPQAKESFGGGFSVAGINNRYNAVYIDGAVNNDVFGLASNGTNGGQTGISPISVDVIDQIQVVISPYDVSLGGFAGGGINAVTKSGTNQFEGTAYYFLQNEGLVGKTNGSLITRLMQTDDDRLSLAEFSKETYGASLGGPLVKNKVFFFTNVEIQKDQTPSPFDFGEYRGDSSEEELNNLSSFLQETYGYDPGQFGSKTDQLDGFKFFGKIDVNLSDQHKLTVRNQYTNAEQLNVNGSNSRTINYENNGVFFPTTTNSFAVELNSTFGNSSSNNFILGITSVRDDRDPIGSDFPHLRIDDGNGLIILGTDQFSTANQLDQNIITLTNNFKLYKGKHTLTIGTHNEFSDFYNLFIRQNFGTYAYDSLDQFLSGAPAPEYDRSYSLVDDLSGDGSQAAAEFKTLQLGFYAQDDIQVNDRLNVTAGIRLDIPFIMTEQNIASTFNTTTLPLIASSYDIENAEGGKLPQGQLMFSPRLGFNYDIMGDQRTILRGGFGVFTSRVPFVWPGGAYVNNGVTIGGVNERNIDGDIDFRPDVQNQYTNANFTVPSGQVDLFSKDFKYPQIFRASMAIDKVVGNGWNASIEGMYTKTLNNVNYINVNNDPTIDFNWTNGPDNRPVYGREDLDPTYSAIYLGTNTNQGYTYTITGSLSKSFASGLNTGFAVTYGDAYSLHEGTSSQNSSQWRGAFNVDGRNNPAYGVSDFSIGTRIIATLGYGVNWGGSDAFKTTISLFYEGESGNPYSYVYGNRSGQNINNETGSTSRNRSLIYIPADESEISLVDPSEYAALNAFIENDPYLSSNRGSYAGKNSNRTPFESQIDFRLLQNLGVNTGGRGHKLQLSVDIFNFANMINNSWGVTYNNPFNYNLINFEGYADDGTTPTFSFDDDRVGSERFDINNALSRWRMRVGVRYIFD